jgi:hypothetical protein
MTTHTTTPAAGRTVQLPSARALFTFVLGGCVLFPLAVFVGEILFTDDDPYGNDGAVESIVSISVVAGIALVLALGIGVLLVRSPERARIGAVVLAAMSVLTLIIFWSGAPGILGAGAAWLSGLTRGGRPQAGAARVAGIIGAFVAVLNIMLSIGGVVLSWIV